MSWVPERRTTLQRRVAYYRLLLDEGICTNVREAVKMTALKRREWEAKETEHHAKRLARSPRSRCRDGYERSLAYKKKLILAEGADCAYCGLPDPQTVDHLVPLARKRDHRRRNLTPACWPCNQEKGNRTPEEWRAARLAAGLAWPPEQRDQNQRTFPGTLPRKRSPFSRSVEEADPLMTTDHTIKRGQVYESCDPRGGFAIRIVAYTPGSDHADVIDHLTGKYPRSILVTSLHASGTTRTGTDRRTGYRLVNEDGDTHGLQ